MLDPSGIPKCPPISPSLSTLVLRKEQKHDLTLEYVCIASTCAHINSTQSPPLPAAYKLRRARGDAAGPFKSRSKGMFIENRVYSSPFCKHLNMHHLMPTLSHDVCQWLQTALRSHARALCAQSVHAYKQYFSFTMCVSKQQTRVIHTQV